MFTGKKSVPLCSDSSLVRTGKLGKVFQRSWKGKDERGKDRGFSSREFCGDSTTS